MLHAHNKDEHALVFTARHNAIVTDPPAPEAGMVARQRGSEAPWIVKRSDLLLQRANDPGCFGASELL